MKKPIIFYVFNHTLKRFLNIKKFVPIIDDKSDEEGSCSYKDGMKLCWRYIKDSKLNEAIKEFESLSKEQLQRIAQEI